MRVRHPLHEWLRPSGYIGQGAGLLAFAIFVFLWLYPLRKKVRALAWTGSIGRWLDVHVTAALTLPLLLAIHAAWRFDGVIGLGYAAILLVCASGVVGRYLYARIPRARTGVELTQDEVGAQQTGLIDRIAATTRLDRAVVERSLDVALPPARGLGIGRTLVELIAGDVPAGAVRALRRREPSCFPITPLATSAGRWVLASRSCHRAPGPPADAARSSGGGVAHGWCHHRVGRGAFPSSS